MTEKTITKIDIRGYHLDGYQHVNNARYLEFLEEGRWQHYENISTEAYAKLGFAFVIVNININYRLPAIFGDVIRIETNIEKIGNSSLVFNQVIFNDKNDKVVCDAKITFVILNQKTGKPFVIDETFRELLLKEVSM